MLMMRPQPRLAIKGAAPTSKSALLTLSRNARSKVPASTFGVGAAISAPPLFTSMSTPEGRDSLLDQPARRAGFLEVVGEEHRLAARADDRMDHLAAPGLATAGDCDAGARFPEPPGDLRPDPEVEPVTTAMRPGSTPTRLPYGYISSILSMHYA